VTFNEWIDGRTVAKIAATTNLPVNTIYSWRHRGTIPRNAWPAIILAFAEVGLNDLLAMESASGAKK